MQGFSGRVQEASQTYEFIDIYIGFENMTFIQAKSGDTFMLCIYVMWAQDHSLSPNHTMFLLYCSISCTEFTVGFLNIIHSKHILYILVRFHILMLIFNCFSCESFLFRFFKLQFSVSYFSIINRRDRCAGSSGGNGSKKIF